MDITIHASFLPTTDPEASLAFYRDALGLEVRQDVEAMQEPTDQDWGVRDCAFRDPAGNTVRLQQTS